MSWKRPYAAVFAAAGWFALGLQLALIVRDRDATLAGFLSAVWTFLRFFTILTNILVAVALARVALDRPVSPRLAAGLALSIAMVGLVYSLFLRSVWNPQGWQLVADHLLHDVTPWAFVIYWLVFVPRGAVTWRDVRLWTIYPLTYLVYALARGALGGKYAYPFIDARAIGYPRVLLNSLGLLALFALAGLAFVALDRLLARRAAR